MSAGNARSAMESAIVGTATAPSRSRDSAATATRSRRRVAGCRQDLAHHEVVDAAADAYRLRVDVHDGRLDPLDRLERLADVVRAAFTVDGRDAVGALVSHETPLGLRGAKPL